MSDRFQGARALRSYRYAVGFDRRDRPADTEYQRRVRAPSFARAAVLAAEESDRRDVHYPEQQDIWLIDEATGEEECHAITLESCPLYRSQRV